MTPFITVAGTAAAIEFYQAVFSARLVNATEIEGVIVHAELDFGNGRLQLGEPNPAYGLVPSPDDDTDCYSIGIYRANADATVELAIAAGSTFREPLATFPSGDRFAVIRDPFGVRWTIMCRIEDLSDAESARRVTAWAATQQA